MAISSTGIGSGLDVNSIVTQLVAIEKQPLKTLQTAASKLQSQVSIYGTIKSQIATMQDAATKLAKDSSWTVQAATSSDTAIATVSTGATAISAELALNVITLAQSQSVFSKTLAPTATVGVGGGTATGKLSIALGTWTGATSFTTVGTPVDVTINASDNYTKVAAAINAANAGVRATVLTIGGMDQLSIQSTTAGSSSGFKITPVPKT